MKSTERVKKCKIESCKKPRAGWSNGHFDSFCTSHKHNGTIHRFLGKLYNNMSRRVRGISGHNKGNWKGKSILPRDVFMIWAKNNPEFLSLYKRYVMCDFDRKLAPSVNRIDSNKGYTLDNMEWMTNSNNSALAATVRKLNNKENKMVYKILGVVR